MSEYQYYEWQTVDRLLTEAEQEAVGNLSSHIEVSSSRAVVTYSYGDFKHDPRQVLARFFDAHLYMANWGSRRLMFRFPSGLLSREAIEPYCVQDRITFKTVNGFDILDMDLSEEEGGTWIEGEGSLSGLIPLRNDILQADYRCVYLAWLKAMSLTGGELPRGRKSDASSPRPPASAAGAPATVSGPEAISWSSSTFLRVLSRRRPRSVRSWRKRPRRISGHWWRSFRARSATDSSVGLRRATQPPAWNLRSACFP